MSVLLNLICRFNATLMKISASCFVDIKKIFLKLIWNVKRPVITILKKNKVKVLKVAFLSKDFLSRYNNQDNMIWMKEYTHRFMKPKCLKLTNTNIVNWFQTRQQGKCALSVALHDMPCPSPTGCEYTDVTHKLLLISFVQCQVPCVQSSPKS